MMHSTLMLHQHIPAQNEFVNYSFLHWDKEKCLAFQEKVDGLLSDLLPSDLNEATPSQLSDVIVTAANSVLSETEQGEPNWFDVSEPVVCPLCDATQRAYRKFLAQRNQCKPIALASMSSQLLLCTMPGKKEIF
jgi:hypothetical protein